VVPHNLHIVVCETPKQWGDFEDAAESLFCGYTAFVPPFPGSVKKFLNPAGAFFQRHGPIRGFLAYKNGQLVGRLAAIVNRTHNIYHQDRTGFFGFPAFVEDVEVPGALFDAAAAWLRDQGCDTMRGPYNPTINDDCGLLLDAEDLPPIIGTTWNPLHMVRSVESCGFVKVREMRALLLDMQLGEPERVKRIRERIVRRNALTLRHIRMNHLREEVGVLGRLYNQTLDRNWGFVPVSYLDFLDAARDFKAIADPRLILIAESRGIPAAFVITFPDFHEVLLAARKWPRALRLPAILAGMKTHRIQRGRLAVLGVAPAFRDRGITGWLFGEQQRRTSARFKYVEISWVEANNTEILENSELMGCVPYRSFGIFEKPIAETIGS
jgi:hypothetical protein